MVWKNSLRITPEQLQKITVKKDDYGLTKFEKGFTCEYITHSKMKLEILVDTITGEKFQITDVLSTSFSVSDISTNGSFNGVSISSKISNAEETATMTANYTMGYTAI